MCGFVERNDLFELCKECVVSDDYIDIAHTFGSRVANEAELFKEQVKKLDIPITVISRCPLSKLTVSPNHRVLMTIPTKLSSRAISLLKTSTAHCLLPRRRNCVP